MKPLADLHIHSNYSDGTCTVNEICALAVKRGLAFFALSDHDTTDGLAAMAKAVDTVNRTGKSLTLIPSIELSSGGNGMFHVLGYGVQDDTQPLQKELFTLRHKRVARTHETLALINQKLGTDLSPDVLERPDEPDYVLGRMHVARLMTERKLVRSTDEAFRKYLGVDKPAYVPLTHISSEDAISILRKSRAVPVLAHPMRLGIEEAELERLIAQLKDAGLMGLEVFHPSASGSDVKRLYRLAQKMDLLVTGGSDFHGDRSMRTKIGVFPPGWQTWEQDIKSLQAAIDNLHAA